MSKGAVRSIFSCAPKPIIFIIIIVVVYGVWWRVMGLRFGHSVLNQYSSQLPLCTLLHLTKTWALDQELHCLPILETTYSTSFLFQYRVSGCKFILLGLQKRVRACMYACMHACICRFGWILTWWPLKSVKRN